MKLRLIARKNEIALCETVADVVDAKGFGEACASLWLKLIKRRFDTAPSIGALEELIGDEAVPDLRGIEIKLDVVV